MLVEISASVNIDLLWRLNISRKPASLCESSHGQFSHTIWDLTASVARKEEVGDETVVG